jgi:decaprenyl-phosphate phosphoribosyltransferase
VFVSTTLVPPTHYDVRPTPPRRRAATARALLSACRPRQWSKNVLVASAPAAAEALQRPAVALEVALAFVAFCLVASATYLVNDVVDREEDRHHLRKRLRPIAAGELSVRLALYAAVALGLGGVALATAVRPLLGLVCLAYPALMLSYSLLWRRLVVADIVVIAAGFVLRAVAGGVATDIALSRRFLLVVSAGAVFIVAGKRYAELRGAPRAHARATLRGYTLGSMRALMILAAIVAVVAYAAFAFKRSEHGPWFELSIAPFAIWLGRYATLLRIGKGEAPEQLILYDPALLSLTAIWVGLFVAGVYVGH